MMKRWMVLGLAVTVMTVLLAGCDWTTNTDHWSDEYNWVNFSGIYRGIDDRLLVTDYTQVRGDTGRVINNEVIARGDGARTQFSGVLRYRPVVSGTLSVSTPGNMFVDQGNGTLTGSNGGSGSIIYETGAWSINTPTNGLPPIASGQALVASYETTAGGSSGTSGIRIYTFTVFQQGNLLRITDNNGSVYEGNFGRVTASGNQIVAQFTATGVSAAGMQVTMAGTFQGQGSEGQGVTGQKQMLGTWIEDGGRTGDINGFSS